MRSQDRLLTHVLRAVLPLVIWGAHFFFCYAWAAVACQRGANPASVLGAVSLLAVGAAALLFGQSLRRACRQHRDSQPHANARTDGPQTGAQQPAGVYAWAQLAIAGLSLAAIIWTCVPMLMVEMCAGPGA